MDLIFDTLKSKPVYAQILLSLSSDENGEAFTVAHNLCASLSLLFVKSDLKKSMSKVLRKDETRAVIIRQDFGDLLEQVLGLRQNVASHADLSAITNELLTSLLDLLSLAELVVVVERLVARPGDIVRTKALRLLETRLRVTIGKDSSTHTTILSLLPRMSELIQESKDSKVKHAAVACVDQICEKLGRKDPSAIAAVAPAISGPSCLDPSDTRLATMGLLCLASMVEVLKEAVIPLLPDMMVKAFDLFAVSLTEGKEDPQLHNAVFALFGALLTHVPFMLSEKHLDSVLRAAYESCNSDLGLECADMRRDVLQLVARNIDVKQSVAAIGRTWSDAVANGSAAVIESLTALEVMIESKSKSAISSNNEIIHDLLLKAFDIRRIQLKKVDDESYTEEEVSEVEDKLNEVSIKMIYKFNDAIFRPLFSRTVEWATKSQDLSTPDNIDKELRQITLFKFLTLFFETLKSIVTSYASIIIPSATAFLTHYDPSSNDSTSSLNLYKSILSTLNSAFRYDADDFFAIPSNFTALSAPLTKQLTHLTTPRLLITHLTPSLIPTLTSFATSLTSSPPHLKTLNQQLCALRSSEYPSVRLASVRVQAALTKELGEEWLANSGEMMIYIQRMLEDEDERVEMETREWVADVQEVLGEDVGEMLQG